MGSRTPWKACTTARACKPRMRADGNNSPSSPHPRLSWSYFALDCDSALGVQHRNGQEAIEAFVRHDSEADTHSEKQQWVRDRMFVGNRQGAWSLCVVLAENPAGSGSLP